jgi:hypothetical protein
MQKYCFTIGLLCCCFAAFTQTNADRRVYGFPYTLVNKDVADLKLLFINPTQIDSLIVLKETAAIAVYGQKAKDGAVIVHTKPGTQLLRVQDVLARYNISPANQQLRICVNKTLIQRPDLLLVEAGEIIGVEITTDRYWIDADEANSKEQFLNIKVQKRDPLQMAEKIPMLKPDPVFPRLLR